MQQLLQKNNKIIINSDIDGIISGLLLHHFCGCEIVGFSNSKDTVWLDTSKCTTLFDAVYIDMFVSHHEVATIDQHIIACDEMHSNILVTNKKKLNPNLDNPRYFSPTTSYVKKYPFGTTHYIVAHLIKEKIYDESIDFNLIVNGIKAIDLFLRADDAMQSTKTNYIENSKAWWQWLDNFSTNSGFFMKIQTYINNLNTVNCVNKKKKIETFLKTTFQCDSPDGGIKNISNEKGEINDNVKNYIEFVAQLMQLQLFSLDLNLDLFEGLNKRITLTNIQEQDLLLKNTIDGEVCFSYAFINTRQISYTVLKK